jgi:hypothetical protein
MTTTYTAVGQTPAGSWHWAATPVLGGNAQVTALDLDGTLVGDGNPIPVDIVEETP